MNRAAVDRACAMMWLILIVITFAFMMLGSGCVEQLAPETKAKMQADYNATQAELETLKNEAKVERQKISDKVAAVEQEAKAKPTAHPIEWANLIIQEVRAPLILVGSIATLLFFVGVGLWAASWFAVALKTMLSSIGLLMAPISGCVAGGCWGTLAFLPWAPLIIAICVSLALTLLIIQLAKAHWDVKQLFGLHSINASAIKTLAAGTPAAPLNLT